MSVVLLLLAACNGEEPDLDTEVIEAPEPVAAARTDETCDPMLHRTQGPTGDEQVTGYLLHGASEDGRKLAVVYQQGEIGGERPDRYVVYTAGSREATSHPIPHRDGPPAITIDIKDPDVAGKYLPEPVAWCIAGDRVHIEGLGTWAWTHVEEPCADEDAATLNWNLCPEEGDCAMPTHLPGTSCWSEPSVPVDIYRAGDVLWVVAERPRRTHTPRMVGGVVLK